MAAKPENILLIRLKSIGDVVLTLPAVHAIRENFPSARITYLTSKENTALLQGFRDVDEVLTLDRTALRSGNPFKIIPEILRLVHRLRTAGYSHVVDFQGYGETAWLTRITGAPHRWGSVYSTGRKWAYTHGLTRNDDIHFVDWNLSLLEQCGLRRGTVLNEFTLPETALAEARQFFTRSGLDLARPTLFIQPFTSSPHKNWPLENFLALAKHWRARGFQVLFGGGPSEKAALEPVRQAGFVVSAGVPLLVTGGLAKLSTVFVGCDTGISHLATAMGCRLVALVDLHTSKKSFPFQHPEWAVISARRGVKHIELGTLITACARAFQEKGLAGDWWVETHQPSA